MRGTVKSCHLVNTAMATAAAAGSELAVALLDELVGL